MLVVFSKEDKLIVPPSFVVVVVVFGAIFPIFGGTTHEHIISSSKEADFLHIYFP